MKKVEGKETEIGGMGGALQTFQNGAIFNFLPTMCYTT